MGIQPRCKPALSCQETSTQNPSRLKIIIGVFCKTGMSRSAANDGAVRAQTGAIVKGSAGVPVGEAAGAPCPDGFDGHLHVGR